jgi:hypothetical protein
MADQDDKSKVVKFSKKTKNKATGFEEKWGRDVARLGFTQVPSLLLKAQRRLGLKPTHLAVILQILDHWWDPERPAWPGKKLLSDKLGINPRQVQRVIAELESRGYIRRVERHHASGGKTSNQYDFTGLVNELKKIAPDFQAIEDETRAKRRAVVRRGYRATKTQGTPN